ncbi:MAG TPA: hypothetical protein VGG11_15540 [Xanthobacteraceae bacterium]
MDREDDHGEEIEKGEGKEEIDEGEKKSRSGAQKEKSSEICGAETGKTLGEKGSSEAEASFTEASGKETGSRASDAYA